MSIAPPPIIQALRRATGAAHERLDADVNLQARAADPGRRADLVVAFRRFHASVEVLLAETPDWDAAGRSKTQGLDAALIELHRPPGGPVDPLHAAPGEGPGWLYVAEGSTLGGHVILKARRAQGLDALGLGFLDPYGRRVGERWRETVAFIDDAVTSGRVEADAVIRGARAAFAYAHAVLADPAKADPPAP